MSPEQNKTIIRRFYEAVDAGRIEALDEFIAPDCVDHNPPPIPGRAEGLEGFRQAFRLFQTATPGDHVVEDLIAEGEKVVARVTGRGTHAGTLFGIPPTGRRVEMTGVVIYRLAGGKIVERWSQHDLFGLLQQLGAIPPASPPQ